MRITTAAWRWGEVSEMDTLTVWTVTAQSPQLQSSECRGQLKRMYFTEHHADQLARALTLNGMAVKIEKTSLPYDALTRLTVSP